MRETYGGSLDEVINLDVDNTVRLMSDTAGILHVYHCESGIGWGGIERKTGVVPFKDNDMDPVCSHGGEAAS